MKAIKLLAIVAATTPVFAFASTAKPIFPQSFGKFQRCWCVPNQNNPHTGTMYCLQDGMQVMKVGGCIPQ